MSKKKEIVEYEEYVNGFTFYGVLGNDIITFRTKGYFKDLNSKIPMSEIMCKHQIEFGGCACFGSLCRTALGGLHRMADINVTSFLIGIGKKIMNHDPVLEVGKRSLILSEHKNLLEGFYFNHEIPFDTVLLVKPVVVTDRGNLKADIFIPEIMTEIDLINNHKYPYFRILAAIGCVSDVIYNSVSDEYEPVVNRLHSAYDRFTGDWYSSFSIVPEQTITLQIPATRIHELTDNVTFVITIVIQFGRYGWIKEPLEKKHAGFGKILKVF